eukprot:3297123-Lingulodinium_polyedra.AAC.1
MLYAEETTECSPDRGAWAPCRSALTRETSLQGMPAAITKRAPGDPAGEARRIAHGDGRWEVAVGHSQGVAVDFPVVGGRRATAAGGRQGQRQKPSEKLEEDQF